jgi:hypothetical protein
MLRDLSHIDRLHVGVRDDCRTIDAEGSRHRCPQCFEATVEGRRNRLVGGMGSIDAPAKRSSWVATGRRPRR